MGFFSGKTRTYVSCTTLKLAEQTPNLVQQSVLATIRNGGSISNNLPRDLAAGLGTKLRQYYKYGSQSYFYGLPQSTLVRNYASITEVERVIKESLPPNAEIVTDFFEFDVEDTDSIIFRFLIGTRGAQYLNGWSPIDDAWGYYHDISELTITPPLAVTESIVRYTGHTITDDTTGTITLNYYGYEKRAGSGVNPNPSDFVYVPMTEPGVVIPGLADSRNGQERYYVEYRVVQPDGSLGPVQVFKYYVGDNTYPSLEPSNQSLSPYMPVVPLRYDNVDFTSDDGSERYLTSKKLLRKMTLNLTELGEGVNASPEIGDIDHAYVMMGVAMSTKTEAGMDYLYRFWKEMEQYASTPEIQGYAAWEIARQASTQPGSVYEPSIAQIDIKEVDIAYNVSLGFIGVTSETKVGNLGKVGTTLTDIIPVAAYNDVLYRVEKNQFRIRKQLTDTTYDEVIVHGPRLINFIYGSHSMDSDLADIQEIWDTGDSDQDNFWVPVNVNIFQSMGLVQQTELAYDAMRVAFHSIVQKKTKWYQSGFFQFVTMVVSIAITIYSAGTLSGTLLSAAALVGSTSAIVGAVVLGAITVGIKYGSELLIDELGLEFGLALIAASVIMGMSGFDLGGLLNADILSAVQGGVKSGFEAALQGAQEDLMAEFNEFNTMVQEGNEFLQTMEAEYSNTTVQPILSPDQYYNLRVHSGNMAAFISEDIKGFYDRNLNLDNIYL